MYLRILRFVLKQTDEHSPLQLHDDPNNNRPNPPSIPQHPQPIDAGLKDHDLDVCEVCHGVLDECHCRALGAANGGS